MKVPLSSSNKPFIQVECSILSEYFRIIALSPNKLSSTNIYSTSNTLGRTPIRKWYLITDVRIAL